MKIEEPQPLSKTKRRVKITLLHLIIFAFGIVVGLGICFHNTEYFVPQYLAQRPGSGVGGCAQNLNRIGLALEAYHREHGEYPRSQHDLVPTYLREFPDCPSAERMTYRTMFGPYAGNNKTENPDYFLVECCGSNHRPFCLAPNYPAYDSNLGMLMVRLW